jgi:vanillate O-demethylase monooxygenase subunit
MPEEGQKEPIGPEAGFVENAWYIAAWNREVGRNLLARRICDQPLVLYRLADGTPVALQDLCCHRSLPLSCGRLEGDLLVCGYHGLTYDPAGRCVRIPSQENINPRMRVKSYPVVEKYRFIWVWLGDPVRADTAALPDYHWNDDLEWRGDGQVTLFNCDYRLILDNLLDLTHETYVHATSIGHPLLPSLPFETDSDGASVTVQRWTLDQLPPPFWSNLIQRARGYTGRCDRWQICHFVPPCHMDIHVGVAEAGSGAPQGNRSKGVSAVVLDSVTPATATTSWYFWSMLRDFCLDDDALTRSMVVDNAKIFEEDRVILEAQQKAILENPSPTNSMSYINLDKGPMRMRQLIRARVAA